METVRSALGQTYDAVEVVVLDDRSSDRSVDLLRTHFPTQIRLVENGENVGLNRNWQQCIDIAQGEYLIILGHDDQLMPECVTENLKLFQEHPDVGFVYYRSLRLPAEKVKELPRYGRVTGSTVIPDLLGFVHVPAPSACMLRVVAIREVGGLDTGYRYCPEVTLYHCCPKQDRLSLVTR